MDLTLRKTCRAQLTKLINHSNDLLNAPVIDKNEVRVLMARIKAADTKLKSINEKVLPTVGEEHLENECNKVLEYEDEATASVARLETWLLTSESLSSPSGNGGLTPNTQVPTSQHKKSVRLPKLELLKFNGDLKAWTPFWEQYRTSIHENNELDDRDKFNYLQNLLTGKAALTISGLTPSQACYVDAIRMLKEEYGSNERIVDEYLQQLMFLTPIKNRNDAVSLRKLFNLTSSTIRSLSALGVPAIQYSMMVKSIIFKTIPYIMRVEFNKCYKKETLLVEAEAGSESPSSAVSPNDGSTYESQINKLLNFIKLECESLEQAQSVSSNVDNTNNTRPNEMKKVFSKYKDNISTAAGLLTSVNEHCLFCKSPSHKTIDCNSSQTLLQRKDILKQNSRCFRCTGKNHNSRFCKTKDLKCVKCNGKHVNIMCDPDYVRDKQRQNSQVANVPQQSVNLFNNNKLNTVYLQTALGYVLTNQKRVLIRMVLDGGSQLTFIKECVSRSLNLPVIGTHKISITHFGSTKQAPARLCNKVSISLSGQYGKEVIEILAVEVPEICFDSLNLPPVNDYRIQNYQLADVKLHDDPIQGISLLIGADNYWKVVTGEYKKISENLTAVNTKLGWTIHGQDQSSNVNLTMSTALNVQIQEENLEENLDLRNFWSLEKIGIDKTEDVQQKLTEEFINEKIKHNGERYEVQLPWKHENINLESNYTGALCRLKRLTNKLIQNSKFEEYDKAVRQYLETDCAESAPNNDSEGKKYFMPHKPVYRDDKATTRLRVVFDASAHEAGFPSLNEQLYAGENLVPHLLGVLLNFRIGKIGLTADIEKAFLQIGLSENERNSHMFLWYAEPINKNNALPEIKEYRMKRVTFGVTCSPFLLAATLKKHLIEQSPSFENTTDILKKSFYVDDLIVSLQSEDHARQFYKETIEIFNKANMNIRKWCSNDENLRQEFNCQTNEVKALGIKWILVTDELSMDLSSIPIDINGPITKRQVLRTISSIFDPLGILGPFVIKSKILMQDIWKLKINWDNELPSDIVKDWKTWCSELSTLRELTIPRYIFGNHEKCELHIYSDASQKAFGSVAYVRIIKEGVCSTNILMAKNRVAPINNDGKKDLTLPKLELTAALCAARLQFYILAKLSITFDRIQFWADSKIALYWIRGEATKWKPYVSSRVNEIQDLSKGTWRHCPGIENPADLLTRGIKSKMLVESKLWKNGPDWLSQNEHFWPPDEYYNEEVKDVNSINLNFVNEDTNAEPIFNLQNYSNLEKIYRITVYVQRFIHNLRNPKSKQIDKITVEELKRTELYWIKYSQGQTYKQEINNLTNGKSLDPKSSILMLNPFLDEDAILRLGGRLQESFLPYNVKHPIILSKNSELTNLIIWKSHQHTRHAGVNGTLNDVRKRFWIIKGRQKIKSLIGKCVKCKKLRGKPGQELTAPLPRIRIMESRPFQNTGIDFAGPLYVKIENGKMIKVYIMLFTCAVVRAVHLELVPSLSTESCIRGLRRFIARRGVPQIIYSDNAKTFKRTDLELKELTKFLQSNEMQHVAQTSRIEWRFIAERAAWWGGWWERLVQTVKYGIKFTLGKASVDFEEMETILTEIESTVNSRPLTYIDGDTDDLLVLTPAHFLLGDGSNGIVMDYDRTVNKNEIVSQWKHREALMKKFWRRWCSDYLQQLRSAHYLKNISSKMLKVGDIVLLHDQNRPRLLWKVVRVIKTFPGRDGRTRACEVEGGGLKLRRPVQLLYPLEIESFAGPEDVENNNAGSRTEPDYQVSREA